MSNTETPYLTYGLGYAEDERLADKDPYHEDVLDLADYLIKKYPKERWSIMHKMFSIGFYCGERSTIGCALSDAELLQHAAELTSVSNQIRIINRLLENVEYSRASGDEFAVHHQVQSGLLDDIGDSLSELIDVIQNILNVICPD
ncbi:MULTISPECIES: hypothetical protein [Enterococcus]|uniref:hypothetical protein n=1 Tax=Enterococcus TaxID=1350 RepID=UPI000763F03B|nr:MULTISPECIES: hypothetical protein [Enterococcus]SAM80385.1 hypothetical protein DTPHA_1406640 [Enterococcus faecium]DAH02126.1 MAG TPA: hypothetical protein [Caudoviricetes sp.]OFT83391.1 hypothetical protein HMPREF3100_17435 [Enterococcus sp. HMSC29A04]OFU65732.1 hypothetical protein HMPREF3128_06050 [Enterococcus sp. HMSC14A10]OJG88648.1 hypothetical protein RV13_GL002058 [Enterococcus raffinosus]